MFHSRHVYGAHKCYQPFHTIAAISHTSAHQSRPDCQWKTPPFLLRQMLIPQLAQLAQLRTHKHAHNCNLSCTAFLLTQKKDDTYNKGHVPPTHKCPQSHRHLRMSQQSLKTVGSASSHSTSKVATRFSSNTTDPCLAIGCLYHSPRITSTDTSTSPVLPPVLTPLASTCSKRARHSSYHGTATPMAKSHLREVLATVCIPQSYNVHFNTNTLSIASTVYTYLY